MKTALCRAPIAPRGLIAAPILLAALAACTTIRDVNEPHEGSRYRLGETVTARVGEVVLDRYNYTAAPVAQPQVAIPAASGRLAIAANTRLVARRVDEERAYCTPIVDSFACFYDLDHDNRFDHVLTSNVGIVSSKRPLETPVPFVLSEGGDARGFKSELVYLGRSDNVVTLSYRDYNDDLGAPSYEQELKYTLNPDPQQPTEIGYRDARLRVLSADNQSLRAEILSSFSAE